MLKTRLISLMIMLWALVGCNLSAPPAQDLIPPSPTTVTLVRGTPVPTLSRVVTTLDTGRTNQQQTPTAEAVEVATTPTAEPVCGLDKAIATTRHRVNARMDYNARTIVVDQNVTFINRHAETLNDLVMNIEPNRYPEAFMLYSLAEINGEQKHTPTFELTGRRLSVQLVEPLKPDCAVEIHLSFMVNVPKVSGGVQAYKGFFGHSDRQVNLGHWLPTVALRAGQEWITRQTVFVGEQEVITQADWDVSLRVHNVDEGLMVAAPGTMTVLGDNHWHYLALNLRDFTMSLSTAFRQSLATSKDGVQVEVYTFDDAKVQTPAGTLDGALHTLTVALAAVEIYSDLFGQYPHERLLIVQGDFPDGMEFSSIVFVSTDWFKRFTGDPAGFLTLITVHEVAHQWWYAQVGNDPALAPWLDEALATYSEYVFLENFYPNLKDWWWQFRVEDYAPKGFVDSTVYEFTSIREYINAVYLRGVKMLHALREDLGTEAFFDWLRRYAESGRGEVVTPNFFWALLSEEQLAATQKTRLNYLRKSTMP